MPGTKPALYKYTVRRGADKTCSCFPERHPVFPVRVFFRALCFLFGAPWYFIRKKFPEKLKVSNFVV